MSVMIEAHEISKTYGVFVAIENISFTIPAHQVVALLGPNGAGKTTIMKILTGYLAPSSGTVSVVQHDVSHDRVAAAAHIGYLPENGPLYLDMTPFELLRAFGETRGIRAEVLKDRIDVVVDECSLQHLGDTPIGTLSKGLRQRVSLALALLHDPELLIVDEPTAGLDPNQVRQFRDQLAELRRTKTIVLSTHILAEAMAVADRVILINRGRLVFDGTPEEMTAGRSPEEAFYRLTRSTPHENVPAIQ